jgi:tRNA threonylcarbamoyladenosine biosynthesis protein TsaB
MNYIEPIQAKIIDEESFCSLLEKNQIIFFGEGADKCKSVIHHPNAKFNSQLIPQATYLGEIGFKKYCNSSFEDIVTFEPFYLKDFLIIKPNLS